MWIADKLGCVDRLDDYVYLSEAMDSTQHPVAGFALYGRSGIGKTFISDLLATKNVGLKALEIPFSATDSAVKDGFAQRALGKTIHEEAERDSVHFKTFEKWLLSYPKKNLLCRLLNDVYQDFKDQYIRKITGASATIEYFTATGEFSPLKVFDSKVEAGISLASQYVIDSLSKVKFLCKIRNAQRIDEVSCAFLSELLLYSPGSKILFEFTCEEIEGKMKRVLDIFAERGLTIKPHPVSIIDFEEFKSSMIDLSVEHGHRPIDDSVIESARERYHETSGNILDMFYHIETLLLRCGKSPNAKLKGTRARLNQIRDAERIIISILALHGGSIGNVRLKSLLGRSLLFSREALARAVSSLLDKRLIQKQRNNYMLYHDDVSHQILTWDEYSRVVQLVAKDMVAFFESELVKTESRSDYIEIFGRLIHLNCIVEDTEAIRTLLVDLERINCSFHSPEEARRALEPIAKIFNKYENVALAHLKAVYCTTAYNNRLYNETWRVLSGIQSNSDDIYIMQAAVLNRMDEHDKALECCSSIIAHNAIPAGTKIRARIVAIYAYRSKCEFEACYRMFCEGKESLTSETESKDQALFLRTAEVILRADLSLPYLRTSKQKFKKLNEKILLAYVCIDLGMQLGRLGLADEAREELNEANDLLAANPTQRFAVTNNLAVINMNEGRFDNNTISMLLYTHRTSTIVFDKLAALMNLLIAYTMRTERYAAQKVADDLISGVGRWKKRDPGLLELIGYNLAWSTKKLGGDSKKVQRFQLYQKKYLEANHWIWKEQKFGPLPEKYILPRKPFRVCWLSPWHFPMSIMLQHQ
ncbi:MAG: hypothetical protein AB7E32_02135 [Desulfovibrio sp.]